MSVRTTLGLVTVSGTAGPGKLKIYMNTSITTSHTGEKGRHLGDGNFRMAESYHLFQPNYFLFALIIYITP